MPIYLVRWPHLRASLIKARDEDDLQLKIDEVADPGGCRWQVYRGPLWVDFRLPVNLEIHARDNNEPLAMDEIVLDGVKQMIEDGELYTVSLSGGDATVEMSFQIAKRVFPNFHKVIDRFWEDLSPDELEEALRSDLKPLLEYDWRLRQLDRRDDSRAAMMKMLGVSTTVPAMMPPPEDDDNE